MKYICPTCKSPLRYERIDDGVIVQEIKEDGTIELIADNSNGSTSVYCSKHHNHKIPIELIKATMDYVETNS